MCLSHSVSSSPPYEVVNERPQLGVSGPGSLTPCPRSVLLRYTGWRTDFVSRGSYHRRGRFEPLFFPVARGGDLLECAAMAARKLFGTDGIRGKAGEPPL